MITLTVLQGPDKGRRFDLNDEQIMLGRLSEAVPLSDLTISRRHAMLESRTDGWVVHDVGAANGVFVNGKRVNKIASVKVGDQIRLGATLLVFGSAQQNVQLEGEGVGVSRRVNNLGDSSIVSTVPSSEDSVVLAAPEPSAAALVHFRVLLQISQAIGSVFDLDPLLNKVMDAVFEHVRCDRGFIGLVDMDTHRVTPKVVRYRTQDQVGKIAVSQTIIQHVISKNEGVLSSNAMADQRFSKGKSVHNLSIRSAICVPIRGREKILGVLHIDSMVANFTYTPDQLRLLTAIGQQTGMAIENARLYQDALKRERLAAAGETVASLSHSIKNILQGIRGGGDVLEIALRKGNLDQAKMGWRMLERNLDKVQSLTMNMLAYSKPRKPQYEVTHLPKILEECLALVESTANERKITVLPEISLTQPEIAVDPDGIHQAVLNLLTNAMDAVESGNGVVTLSSYFDAVSEEAVIEVQDNGVGINMEDQEKLFQPFYSTKGQKGTGLGLAVTRKIVEEHQGKIELESKLGQGTTFRLRLPMNASHDASQTQWPGNEIGDAGKS